MCSSSVLSSKMVVVSNRLLRPKRLLANEAFSCLLVSMNILSSHDHELFNNENVADLALLVIEPLQENINYIISSVDDWRLCVLWISADNNVAKPEGICL